MYDAFEKLLKEHGIKAADFARATGISEATISTWKRRGTISAKHLKTISDYFNVPTDILLGTQQKSQDIWLTPDDLALLALYKELNDVGKEKVRNYAADLQDRYKED